MRLKVRGTQLRPGDVLRTGKVVSFRMPLDASQTPGLMARLNALELVAVGFVGDPLPVLFTDAVRFIIDRPEVV